MEHWKWLRERDNIFFKERVDLMQKKWTHGVGKDVLEHYFSVQLYGCLPEVEGDDSTGRWSSSRLSSRNELSEMNEQEDWPDKYDLPPEVYLYKTESNPIGYFHHPHWYKFTFGEYVKYYSLVKFTYVFVEDEIRPAI